MRNSSSLHGGAGHADHGEPGVEDTPVGQPGQGRQDLAAVRSPEAPKMTMARRGLGQDGWQGRRSPSAAVVSELGVLGVHAAALNSGVARSPSPWGRRLVVKACPPNWLRRAETSRRPKASCFCEAKRAKRAEEMTGADTPRSIASSTVQRPSPESATTPSIGSKPELGPQGPLGQLQEPGPDHRAIAPDGGDLMEVEVELGCLGHDLKALGVGLHQAVLDAVVDHLHEVAGARRPDVGVAPFGGQGDEDRFADRHRLLGPADHQAVALLQAPDSARGSGVHQGDPVGGEPVDEAGGLLVVELPPSITMSPGLEEPGQGGDGVVGRLRRRGP